METKVITCPKCGSTDVENINGTYVCFSCRTKFSVPAAEKVKPMELFISYGHPESMICERIKAALKERGHHVWFDATNMVHGEDWREQIADGIAHSDGVISCLSKHSVRDPGVSLDELSIAIGVRGGNIKTILLEEEQNVRPPASVSHIQWLDMSQWREYLDEEGKTFTAEFEPWFQTKMAELIQVVESEESRQFVGQITTIREKLHINYNTDKQKALLGKGVVGRDWLVEKVEAWLDDPAGVRLCVLYGDPGVGKSAFAAKYIHYNPRVAAGLFCEYDKPVYNDARTVTMTLAYLLACRLPDYRQGLTDILEHEKRLGELNASELFDLLLASPLASLVIDGGRQTLCVVIDGLDECAQGERNALAEVLARYAPRLPSWLRILVTARDVSAVTGPLQGTFQMELRGGQTQNRQDIREYFIEKLQGSCGDDPAWPRALDTLVERSGGIFLYATLVANGIREGKVSIQESDKFPEGLSDAFYQWFSWSFPDDGEYKSVYRAPLGVLLAAPEALPVGELKRIFDWDENQVNDLLRRIEVLLKRGTNDFRDETISFSHQYLSQWLDSPDAGRFRSSRSAAVERMGSRFYELFQADHGSVTHYEAVYVLPLLDKSGQTARRDELMVDHDLLWRVIDAGDYCREWGKLDTALQCFGQAQGMAESAAKQNMPWNRRDLSASYERVAGILKAKGQLDEAYDLNMKCLAIADELAHEEGTLDAWLDLCTDEVHMADLTLAMGEPDAALLLYDEALSIMDQLTEEKDTPRYIQVASGLYSKKAGLLEENGQIDEAMQLYTKAASLYERLVYQEDTPATRWDLSANQSRIAGILAQKGRWVEAQKLYENSLALIEQLRR